jgi:hypothetical protein
MLETTHGVKAKLSQALWVKLISESMLKSLMRIGNFWVQINPVRFVSKVIES